MNAAAHPHPDSSIGQAIEILRLSHDGDDLTPLELKIVELAVNARLCAKGKQALAQLLERLRNSRPLEDEVPTQGGTPC